MKRPTIIAIIVFIVTCLLFYACNKTSDTISRYIKSSCNFNDTCVFFNSYDSTNCKAPCDYIDLKEALETDYDTLYLISTGFESDISDIIGFKYKGGDFTTESEDYNLLLLVKQKQIVYEGKIKKSLDVVNFSYSTISTSSTSFCLLKHSSSIYKVKREKDGLKYRYYLYNIVECGSDGG
jgi:hypothetical protein